MKKITKSILAASALLSSTLSFANPSAYIVYDFKHNQVLEGSNLNTVRPIASVTKLMTANVFLKLNNGNSSCFNEINSLDNDTLKGTSTRLPKNVPIPCSELLYAMLVSSDNYAASSLSRSITGVSRERFVQEMNKQASEWGMTNTSFSDPSGLSPRNVSTVADLAILSHHSMKQDVIRNITNTRSTVVDANVKKVSFNNTNALLRNGKYNGLLSKTGFTREAGYNLVFVNGQSCGDRTIGVISLNNKSSSERAGFTDNKLSQYHCN